MLRQPSTGRVPLSDGERQTLAEIGQKLGKHALEEVASIVKPKTILAWHRTLGAQKCDGSQPRNTGGRPRMDKDLERLVVRMAREKRPWGYDRLAGAVAHVGSTISDQTVGHILKRQGIPPAPTRKKTTTWQAFIRPPRAMLLATDFFTAEVWTWGGRVTDDVLFVSRIRTREVHVAGVTPHPDQRWMRPIARHVTMAEWGVLKPGEDWSHDRDGTCCPAFQQLISRGGLNPWIRGVGGRCRGQDHAIHPDRTAGDARSRA
jgi:putative transposase